MKGSQFSRKGGGVAILAATDRRMVPSSGYPRQVTWRTFRRPWRRSLGPCLPSLWLFPSPLHNSQATVSPAGFVWPADEDGEAVL